MCLFIYLFADLFIYLFIYLFVTSGVTKVTRAGAFVSLTHACGGACRSGAEIRTLPEYMTNEDSRPLLRRAVHLLNRNAN